MTVEGLLNQTVTLRRRSGFTRTDGEATPTWDTSTTKMYLEPRGGFEEGGSGGGEGGAASGRRTPVGQWFGVGRADVDFTSWDEVVVGTFILEIASPVRPIPNPRLDTISHHEMDLLEVDQQ